MKIQSYIDLITNSSTEVFTFANNIEGVKEIINAVLVAGGSKQTCEDLFDISTEYDNCRYDEYVDNSILNNIDYIKENPELKNMLDIRREENSKLYKDTDWNLVKSLENHIIDYLQKNNNLQTYDEWAEEYNDGYPDYPVDSHYVIKAKDNKSKKAADTLTLINNLFDYRASYC